MSLDVSSIQERRELMVSLRNKVTRRHESGEDGIEICNWFSDQLDDLLRQMMRLHLQTAGLSDDGDFSIICVGGNGRRRPTPYSDIDLLLVAESRAIADLEAVLTAFVRDCWDTGFQLGHSIRTPDDVVGFASEDVPFATSLIDMRHLLGSLEVFTSVSTLVETRIFQNPADQFVDACVVSRRDEWMARGDSVNQLEPDVKRSPGGLRDLHLINWVTYTQFGDSHPSSLLEHNAVGTEELASLNSADRFLTSLRLDLHCRAGLKQDVLTRDLQLKIAASRGETQGDHRRSVENFMQEYFRHTSRVAEIARRVTETVQRPGLFARLKNAILPQRDSDGFLIQEGVLNAPEDFGDRLSAEPEAVMLAFTAAAKYEVVLSAELRRLIGRATSRLPSEPSRDSCSRFRAVLRAGNGLPLTLRAMYETRVLDWLVPAISEIRCLMQFNQYHSFTVDEHTLKTIDEVVSFADDETPVGSAYNSLRHKATLHIALILHDIAKGRDGDHSIVGEQIADEVAVRLQTAENKKRMIMFLVRQHLVMPDLAFRRDITDQALLMDFARMVGAPELLRMLYVLSVADIKAVGPDVWTDWKGELLADLYNRTMRILSGRPINHLEQERLQLVREHVRSSIVPVAPDENEQWPEWIDRQLDALPPFYLMTEQPARIAKDLDVIQQLGTADVRIEGVYDADTDTVTYRIFASSQYEPGSFHKVSGVLSGLRMNIHTAQSCTTADSTMIGSFLVTDNDFVGNVADDRIRDVCAALVSVLTGKLTVDHIFRRSGLFRFNKKKGIQPVPPQVSIDNDCSETHTVIDVFAMDSPGLLHTLALAIYNHGLSVDLTRIATNVDQVVDVFYVVDSDRRKVEDSQRLHPLWENLMHELTELQEQWLEQ
ncbi:MAG: [protein-PII] uridylyltransferase [Fuerstiella sp.]|jgi:[protein-PII] uridylyltransferase|nr:[protein-PII] uridylyltransferase [Fuerstiella sp.]